jgi:hypothetical protein
MRRDKKMTGRSFHSGWRLLHNGPREAKSAFQFIAGWSSPVARQAHNLKVRGSNPLPATKIKARDANALAGFFCPIRPMISHLANAIKIKAFSRPVIPCWRVYVTRLAHGNGVCSPSVPRSPRVAECDAALPP